MKYFILLLPLLLLAFSPNKKKKQTLRWGLVGYQDEFVTDETEILVEEWLEYIYYNDLDKFPKFSKYYTCKEKHLSPEEIKLLKTESISSSLLPDPNVYKNIIDAFIFHGCKECGFTEIAGVKGVTAIPIEADSLKSKYFQKRILEFLESPIRGITFEQANDYCIWRTKIDSLIERRWIDEGYSMAYEERYKYTLPTAEQHKRFNYQMTDVPIKKKYLSNFNYKGSQYRKKDASNTAPVGGFDYFHYPHTTDAYWVKNSQGNVAEMTNIKGIAKGGSYFHIWQESLPDSNNYYSKAEPWLGFRCVGVKVQK